jgi:hypothetical protein
VSAVDFIQQVEELVRPFGYHAGLTGSCLFKGYSSKDVDVILYPHKTSQTLAFEDVLSKISVLDVPKGAPRNHAQYGDLKNVFVSSFRGRRVDFFFLI